MLTSDNVREAVDEYGNMLYRLCLVMLRNTADAEDAVQETFIKYMLSSPPFNDDEHEKAWLITVASNKCRDMLRSWKRHCTESEDIQFLGQFFHFTVDADLFIAWVDLSDDAAAAEAAAV